MRTCYCCGDTFEQQVALFYLPLAENQGMFVQKNVCMKCHDRLDKAQWFNCNDSDEKVGFDVLYFYPLIDGELTRRYFTTMENALQARKRYVPIDTTNLTN